MENTKRKTDYILSKGKDRLLAACLLVIPVLCSCIVALYVQNGNLHKEVNDLTIRNEQDKMDFLKRQNDYLFGLIKQVDSAKAALEIFKIKKEMK